MAKNNNKINKKNKKSTIYLILALLLVLLVIYLFLKFISFQVGVFAEKETIRTNCPYAIKGNISSDFVIQYIDSPFCMWCWVEESVLKRVIEKKGALFRLETYDIRYCSDIVDKYKISGTPSFIFVYGKKEYVHSGFISEQTFYEIFCKIKNYC